MGHDLEILTLYLPSLKILFSLDHSSMDCFLPLNQKLLTFLRLFLSLTLHSNNFHIKTLGKLLVSTTLCLFQVKSVQLFIYLSDYFLDGEL